MENVSEFCVTCSLLEIKGKCQNKKFCLVKLFNLESAELFLTVMPLDLYGAQVHNIL